MPPPRRFGRRALLVGAGAAALVAAGTAEGWLPATPTAGAAEPTPEQLRDAVLSGVVPHTGLAESTGGLGLPDIPRLESASALLSTTTRIRVQVAARDRWRIDQLTPAGEIDTYRLGDTEYLWDYGGNRLTTIRGTAPVRLPRASDLAPSDLARRLLGITATEAVSALPPRRIAGYAVPGIRVVPADPAGTVGRIDVWALPGPAGTPALPMAVEIAAKGAAGPVLSTAFTSVEAAPPSGLALRPDVPPGAESVSARPGDLAGVLRGLGAPPPPDSLAGRARVELPGSDEGALPGIGVYGTGVSRFVLVPAGRDVARQIIGGAGAAGGVPIAGFAPDRAVRVATPLLGLVVVRRRGGGFLLAGTVVPDVLEAAATELVPGVRR
ncbi:hypothetical protein [Pseudonocardia sp. KRD291]|uniref:hypothetical protein n=1 Tax=Pseudonocardia sp. KRD291 TaxID=2792007 RepID=UPI001C49CD42|nr:hypothetical protein [Pseudonocardia sp. KRD291]MBW0103947.1 hypothetical protein [Pseudonocardia sp. KRD291]